MTAQDLIRQLPSYRHYGLGPFSMALWPSYLLSMLIFALAMAIRWLLSDELPPGYPYLSFFPAVVITCFLGGVWPGTLSAILSGLASWYYFIPPFESLALTSSTLLALAFFVFIVTVDILLIQLALGAFVESDRLTRENVKLADFQKLLIRELDHRIKNLFSVVSSVVKLSARYAETPGQLAEDASDRILALGRSHSALWRVGQDQVATVQSVAQLVLEPYLSQHGSRIRIAGESPILDVQLIQIISLIFHELATNAAKYGALLQPGGAVEITSSASLGGRQELTIEWRESGIRLPDGEPLAGFGSELIERLVTGAGGTLKKVFGPDSMVASVSFARS
ncbi:MAG: DUF4118 domain-containing protein [Alphaproteobacteria bacterium]|nr:DUF4118 domain-containing protein [Alphaproteobacteria bacterium]